MHPTDYGPGLTGEEHRAIMEISSALNVIGELFRDGSGTPAGLRIAIAQVRQGCDLLEAYVDRWEANEPAEA